MEVGLAKLSTKGQIVIPNNIRLKMGIKKDEQLIVMSDNDEIIIRSVKGVLNTDRKKSNFAKEFIKAMRHDKILQDMEAGREIGAEEALR